MAVLWGRRRLGKTRLLVAWNRLRAGIYTVADESAETIQRRFFAQAVSSKRRKTPYVVVDAADVLKVLR
jgi:hypothetical protein